VAQRHGPHKDKPMSIRMPAELREWLKAAAARDGLKPHGLVIEAVREKRERDSAAQPASAG
jgi:predicted DNA-binding protein